MKKIAFITPPDVLHGFSLAGIPQTISEIPDAEKMLKAAMAEPDNGLVIIDERLMKVVAEDRLRDLEYNWHGVILILPSPEKPPIEEEDYAARLIRRAIGYHVRLKL